MKSVFIDGPISSDFVSKKIAAHQHKHEIGAHSIFLGQVRADEIEGKNVIAIDYTAYEDMANKVFHDIKESVFDQFDITCMHIYHSKGLVKTGEICFFVFVSAPRRKVVFEAIEFAVNTIKEKTPVFGKEILEDESYAWKENTP
jgi:molybdopterin synthase catalytic subunit